MSTGPGSLPRDPGVQPERTRLAWRRTTLAFAVATVLLFRGVLVKSDGPAEYVLAAVGALALTALLVVAHRRGRELKVAGPSAPAPRTMRATVLCTFTLVILGVVLLW
ncbi:DUF202 domain-containing protein [Streptomyces gobiensis]|uniref:DUF202 domain-containing protein n=1 Tax=Streptomyces gobiensis TaxID=2875706 RepID=UPI001E49889A|nr:DUF202 domain-containing protein [Streptomyces gobiensis]UGY90546.1 DUF202 domain-containing protein [Streptomyces gobiensis]